MRLGDGALRALTTIGAISFLAAATIHISTFLPVSGEPFSVAQFVLVPPMFVVFGGAILAVGGRRPRIEIPRGGLGLAIAVLVLVLFVYSFINFFITRLPGQPVSLDGSYYFSAHGARTPISREQYEEALRLQVRLFTGDILLFMGVGTALLFATLGAPAAAAAGGAAIVIDLQRRRMDMSPRARLVVGVFGVISALVVAYWLLLSGSVQGDAPTIWVVGVIAMTLFNVIRYWRWIARGRAESPQGRPEDKSRR